MHNLQQMNDLINIINSPNIDLKKEERGKLSSISNTQNLISDFEEAQEKIRYMEMDIDTLKQKNMNLIQENQKLKMNNEKFSEEMKSMSSQIGKMSQGKADYDAVKKLEEELTLSKQNLDKEIQAYQIMTEEYEKKNGIQFKQLKKFLNEKNEALIELKKKLAKYEGEN